MYDYPITEPGNNRIFNRSNYMVNYNTIFYCYNKDWYLCVEYKQVVATPLFKKNKNSDNVAEKLILYSLNYIFAI